MEKWAHLAPWLMILVDRGVGTIMENVVFFIIYISLHKHQNTTTSIK
jgi:hypothetical protein